MRGIGFAQAPAAVPGIIGGASGSGRLLAPVATGIIGPCRTLWKSSAKAPSRIQCISGLAGIGGGELALIDRIVQAAAVGTGCGLVADPISRIIRAA